MEGKKRVCTRAELADTLENLARRIRKGELDAGGTRVRVPETLRFRMGVSIEEGIVRFHLEGEGTIAPDSHTPARASGASPQFKERKWRLSSLFYKITESVRKKELPDARLVENFVRESRAFSDMADPAWGEAFDEYLECVERLVEAVHKGEANEVVRSVTDLRQRMTACHDRYQ